MAFEKRIWVDVPDPDNLPEVPQEAIDIGQNFIPKMDADELNRIENGIKNNETEVKKTSDNTTSLIAKINSMPFMVVRDENGATVNNFVRTDVNIENTGSYISGSVYNNIDVVLSECTFDNLCLNLDGQQPTVQFKVNFSSHYTTDGTGGNWQERVDISITDSENLVNISGTGTFSIVGGTTKNNSISIIVDSVDTIKYLYEKNPKLNVNVVYHITHTHTSSGSSYIRITNAKLNFLSIEHNKSQRYEILLAE